MLKSIVRLIGGSSERVLKKLDPIVEDINAFEKSTGFPSDWMKEPPPLYGGGRNGGIG